MCFAIREKEVKSEMTYGAINDDGAVTPGLYFGHYIYVSYYYFPNWVIARWGSTEVVCR